MSQGPQNPRSNEEKRSEAKQAPCAAASKYASNFSSLVGSDGTGVTSCETAAAKVAKDTCFEKTEEQTSEQKLLENLLQWTTLSSLSSYKMTPLHLQSVPIAPCKLLALYRRRPCHLLQSPMVGRKVINSRYKTLKSYQIIMIFFTTINSSKTTIHHQVLKTIANPNTRSTFRVSA